MEFMVRTLKLASLALALLVGCDDAEPRPLPPSLYDDPVLAAQVAAHDGIEGVAPLLSAFANGAPSRYWHLGQRSDETMPVHVLCTESRRGACVPIDHPPVADHLPGEPGYSPFMRVYHVFVPEGFEGRLRNVEEVDQAVRSGTARAPVVTSSYMHCPIAGADAELDLGDGRTARPQRSIWVRGVEARCFDFSATHRPRPTLSDGRMLVRHVYVISREGEAEPLIEAVRMTDLTGDGDQLDSNNIFGVDLADGDYTPLWRMVVVTVPADYASIDTSMDQGVADYRSVSDMFEVAPDYTITPIAGQVVAYELTDVLIDCPLQSELGSL